MLILLAIAYLNDNPHIPSVEYMHRTLSSYRRYDDYTAGYYKLEMEYGRHTGKAWECSWMDSTVEMISVEFFAGDAYKTMDMAYNDGKYCNLSVCIRFNGTHATSDDMDYIAAVYIPDDDRIMMKSDMEGVMRKEADDGVVEVVDVMKMLGSTSGNTIHLGDALRRLKTDGACVDIGIAVLDADGKYIDDYIAMRLPLKDGEYLVDESISDDIRIMMTMDEISLSTTSDVMHLTRLYVYAKKKNRL